jgi:sugar lactone lactonase YvrE
MKNPKFLLRLGLATALALSVGAVLSGCQPAQTRQVQSQLSSKAKFYPGPPDKPRLQFLTSISTESDLGIRKKYSGLERLIAGTEDPANKELIGKPYGLVLYEGRLYVCDVQKKLVEVLDLKEKTFEYLSKEQRMVNPVNMCIEKGRKYVADPVGGAVFVFGRNNALEAILGGDLKLKPIDVAVRANRCYVTDMDSNQVVVLDIGTGREIGRIGKPGDGDGQFGLIGDIAMDAQENIYVTDKALARIIKFDPNGTFLRTFGKAGDSIHDFARPKGIEVDREGRMWVVDAASEVVKAYNSEGQLLMFFGLPGSEPGNTNLPASVAVDYDNVELFQDRFAEGAQIEFLVLVSNQYGTKINIYGFGSFPRQEEGIQETATKLKLDMESEPKAESRKKPG